MAIDLYQTVTDRIIASLEQGTAPWVKPWKAEQHFGGLPMNAKTRKPYRGINVPLLWHSPFASNQWVTFKQALDMGGNVRKGSKGSTIVFFDTFTVRDRNAPADSDATRTIPMLKHYTVFNVEQCDGLPLDVAPVAARPEPHAADAVLSQATIRHGGDRAFYTTMDDHIQMPHAHQFRTVAEYYATALHELTHWTGHDSRMARQYGKRFGDEAYAREELVAEMGAAFLCARFGIDGKLQHAEYIANWLTVLKSDKRAVLVAAGAAQKAADYALRDCAQSIKDDEAIAA